MARSQANEIEDLKRQIKDLTERVVHLETELEYKLGIGSGWESEAEAAVPRSATVVPEPMGVPAVETPIIELVDSVEPVPVESLEPLPEPEKALLENKQQDKPDEPASLESRIGTYWLNRLGIGSLVIGIALFIIYSFQSWGAVVKIVMGVLAGIALIGGGEWYEKKLDKDDSESRNKYWGLGLIGGGWSVLYFTAFAAYHIADVKILSNLFVEELLLTGLCAGALWHACERKSQTIATFAVMLSFVTISFSQISAASVCWILALALGSYALSVFKQWPRLLMWTTIGGYGSYFLIVQPKMPVDGMGNPWAVATLGCLSLFWLACNAAVLSMKEVNDDSKGRLVVATGFNGMCYAFVGTQILTYLQAEVQFNYLMPLLTGALYCSSFTFARKRNMPSIANMHLIMGLSLLTLTLPMLCRSKEWFNAFWLIELAMLVYAGLKYDLPAIRWFAALLSLVCFVSTIVTICITSISDFFNFKFSESFLQCLIAAVVYGFCANMYRLNKGKVHPAGQTIYVIGFLFFSWLAPALACNFLFSHSKDQEIAALVAIWIIEYSTFLWLGFNLQERALRRAAKAGFICAAFFSVMVNSQYAYVSFLVVVAYLGAAIYTRYQKNVIDEKEARRNYIFYLTGGSILAWGHTFNNAGSKLEFLALRWAGEAAVLVGLGHWLKDRYTRILGALWFLNVFVVMLFQIGNWNGIEDAVIVVILYLMGATYRQVPSEYAIGNERRIAHYYESAATVIATLSIWALVPQEWLTVAFSLEALTLLAAGFMVPDKALRVSGLLVFCLLGLKLLFIDLASARTDARILSFIMAGVILLAASYTYTKYAQRLLKDDSQKTE